MTLPDRPVAVKTGTTNDYRDAWTMGYTPDLAVGVWVGNADYKPMQRLAGSLGAAPIWHDVMARGLQGTAAQRVPGAPGRWHSEYLLGQRHAAQRGMSRRPAAATRCSPPTRGRCPQGTTCGSACGWTR